MTNDEVGVTKIDARLFGAAFSMIVSIMRTDIGTRMEESAVGAAGKLCVELIADRSSFPGSSATDVEARGLDVGASSASEACAFS